jgi:hypothetical protein
VIVNGYFDAVYGMNILHAVKNDPSDLFNGFVWTHNADGISLDKDITLSQEFYCLT